MSAVLFWVAILLLAYAYAGFPLLVIVVGRLWGRPVHKDAVTPKLSVIIAAYNEESGIAARLDNVLACDYPPDQLEIIVASDGSSDATEDIVSAYANWRVRLLALPRRGKIRALDEAVRYASGDVLVFSDANIHFHPGALRALAANFADPAVGGVAGHSAYRVPAGGESSGAGEGLYWRYDLWLKGLESRTGSIVSAHGPLYAIRRELYRRPAEAAVTDDFAISTAVVEQGWRLVFEPEAFADEDAVTEAQREFRRKVRLMTRGWRSVALRRRLLNPFHYGFYSVVFFSHQVLRRLVPLLLLVLLGASSALAGRAPLYAAALIGQLAFYAVAAAGYYARRSEIGRLKPLMVPFYYCLANAAALLALLSFVRGQRIELWQPQRYTVRS